MPNIEQHGYGTAEPEPFEYPYQHFGPTAAREYYELSRDLAAYVHDEDIASVVLTDKAARPAYVGLTRCWRALYPDEPRPLVCFMNPLGIQPEDCLTPERRVRGVVEAIASGVGQLAGPRTESEIVKDFEATFAELARHKDHPLLVADTCLHSGESIRSILERLRIGGFSDVRLGVVDYSPYGQIHGVVPDVVFRDNGAIGGCYPFGHRDRMVSKTFDRVISSPSRSPVDRRAGRELRAEAQRIIGEALRHGRII